MATTRDGFRVNERTILPTVPRTAPAPAQAQSGDGKTRAAEATDPARAPTPSTERDARAWRRRDIGSFVLLGVTLLLVYGALRTLWPFVTAIVLGAWAANIVRPLFRRLAKLFHGRDSAAALLTAGLLAAVASPFALFVAAIVPAARSLFDQLRGSSGWRNALEAVVSNGGTPTKVGAIPQEVAQLIRDHGANASKAVALIAGASIEALVGVFVFFVIFFASLVNGARLSLWLDENAPLDRHALERLRRAFFQAGRGLLVGNGVTALVQGAIATATYFALGVPRALLLGFLSAVAALIPLTGPTIVWIPVAAGLLLTGHPAKAAALALIGVVVIGTVDNVLRPYLAKRANVGLDTTIVLVAIFGGLALFGAWGLLLGPLVVRLAAEALSIVRERGLLGRSVAS